MKQFTIACLLGAAASMAIHQEESDPWVGPCDHLYADCGLDPCYVDCWESNPDTCWEMQLDGAEYDTCLLGDDNVMFEEC